MIKEAIGTGSTVDEAKAAAMLELGISDFDDFTVEVLQTPAKKILGLFGGSPAKVKVSVERPDEKPERKERPNKKVEKKAPAKQENKKAEKKEKAEAPKEEKPELPLEKTNLYADTADYIKSIVLALGMSECEITEMSNEEEIYFELQCGDDYGIIIGKRGETLDALQYLARMIANKGSQNYKRVSINVGNYREKREETLKILARKTAAKAVRQGRSISLEPMNPYERRIIHAAVSEIEGVTSKSIGEEPYRKVVISSVNGRPERRQGGKKGGYDKSRRRREPQAHSMDLMKTSFEKDYKKPKPEDSMTDGELYGKIEL